MTKQTSFIVFLLIVFSYSVFAEDAEQPQNSKSIGLSLRTETTLPLFVGAGVGYAPSDQFDFSLFFGITPEIYYRMIGQVSAQMGGNAAYKDVIVAAFQNNNVLKCSGQYFFDRKGTGWSSGISGYFVTSSGSAPIDTVLTAATGRDYTTLKNLLTATGRPTNVDMKGALMIFEINAGYDWKLNASSDLRLNFGLAKVFTADVQLKTGLSNFEATQTGSSLMRQSESDLEKIIVDNGFSPILGIDYSFNF